MHELKFECRADFLGRIPLDGNKNSIDPASLSEYGKTLDGDRSASTKSCSQCSIRMSASGMFATFSPHPADGDMKIPFTSLLVGHVIEDRPNTTVWVVREPSNPESVNVYVWRCDREEDAKRLMDVFLEVRGKKKMEKLAQIRQKLEEKGLFANRIPANGLVAKSQAACAESRPVTIKIHSESGSCIRDEAAKGVAMTKPSKDNVANVKCQVTVKSTQKHSPPVNGTKVLPTKDDATIGVTSHLTGQFTNTHPPANGDDHALIKVSESKDAPSHVVSEKYSQLSSKSIMQNSKVGTADTMNGGVHARTQQSHLSDIERLLKAERPNPNRQVIVAASRCGQNKKPDTRQRQPALLISSNTHQDSIKALPNGHSVRKHNSSENSGDVEHRGGGRSKDSNGNGPARDVPRVQVLIPSLVDQQRAGLITSSFSLLDLGAGWPTATIPSAQNERSNMAAQRYAGVPAMSYGRWLKDSAGSGDPEITDSRLVRKVVKIGGGHRGRRSLSADGRHREHDGTRGNGVLRIQPHLALVNAKLRNAAISRSESLNSQGSSSSSESVAENQPKSVLKKPKRVTREAPKKNVTFNAFATVQVMEV